MEMKLTLDRLEEGIAILLDAEGKIYRCSSFGDCSEGDILLCEIGDDGDIVVKEKMIEEKNEKTEDLSNRLRALFSRGDR
ncbi:MAG: hypothetical protein IKJ91_00785 [Clostridia bacterium]|nr:hypothetical protein [Clostridia bacterium]